MIKSFATILGLAIASAMLINTPVFAARQPSVKINKLGNDISWPQCGKSLPTNQAFGIVGVNGGLATTDNPCFKDQLLWAHRSTGTTPQPKAQLYVNTANPGEIISEVKTWPTSNTDRNGTVTSNPYQTCDGTNTLACSWQYGWNRALDDVEYKFNPWVEPMIGVEKNPAAYIWWLDVETENTWQSGSAEALARNAATLEGMNAYFKSKGISAGLYSTGYQWKQIVGTISPSSSLYNLPSWLAGARNESSAKSNCSLAPLVGGGKVILTQFVSGGLDYDYSCI